MAITEAEARRVFQEGGSVLVSGAEAPFTTMEDLRNHEDLSFGSHVTLDSPSHPKNLEAARRLAELSQVGAPADMLDAETREALEWVRQQYRGSMGLAGSPAQIHGVTLQSGIVSGTVGEPITGNFGDLENGGSADSGASSESNSSNTDSPKMTQAQKRRMEMELQKKAEQEESERQAAAQANGDEDPENGEGGDGGNSGADNP